MNILLQIAEVRRAKIEWYSLYYKLRDIENKTILDKRRIKKCLIQLNILDLKLQELNRNRILKK